MSATTHASVLSYVTSLNETQTFVGQTADVLMSIWQIEHSCRGLQIRQKRLIFPATAPHILGKSALHFWQKSLVFSAKEIYSIRQNPCFGKNHQVRAP